MDNQAIINAIVEFVKQTLVEAEGGHDWWHIYRVWKNAQHIGKEEGNVDMLVVELLGKWGHGEMGSATIYASINTCRELIG